MDGRQLLILFIVLSLTATFLFLWKRRDAGIVPDDRLPEVLHEPLDGRSPRSPAQTG